MWYKLPLRKIRMVLYGNLIEEHVVNAKSATIGKFYSENLSCEQSTMAFVVT